MWRGGQGSETDRDAPLPVLNNAFNPVQLVRGMADPRVFVTDMHNYVWQADLSDTSNGPGEGPWALEKLADDRLSTYSTTEAGVAISPRLSGGWRSAANFRYLFDQQWQRGDAEPCRQRCGCSMASIKTIRKATPTTSLLRYIKAVSRVTATITPSWPWWGHAVRD